MSPSTSRTFGVLGEIALERERQRERHHWDDRHDDQLPFQAWSWLIQNRAVDLGHPWPEAAAADPRRLLIEIASIAVAAVEAIDRSDT